MEQKKATKVGCQACKSNKNVVKTQTFMMIFGGIMFLLATYGSIRLVQDIISIF